MPLRERKKEKRMISLCIPVTHDHPRIRLLGRMDPEQTPPALDWTGSGAEVQFRGSDLWAELEAPAQSPVMWMIVLADGRPVTRFPVEPGVRFYPLLLGMEPEKTRLVTLMKETQCMPASPEATVLLRTLRMNGELEELKPYDLKIEFIGDSLTSGEGALAPKGNEEWITPWFSARGNYSWYACRAVNAERRVLSQSGWGVCWSWDHQKEGNLSDGYERIAGPLKGEAAEARGCQKDHDFSAWQPDAVCIRLMTNDCGGMNFASSFDEDRETVIRGGEALIRKVRKNNPAAKIIWILPGKDVHPELAAEAVDRAAKSGIRELYVFTPPEYGPEDMGAREHPNAEWNRMMGEKLGAFLKTLFPGKDA